jgi:beta-lactamase regulating signal transducer with metallopeptidase domain
MTTVFVVTIRDVVTIICVVVVLIACVTPLLLTLMRQRRCLHNEGVTETSTCDAICRKCRKNLGVHRNLDTEKGSQ